MECQSRYEKHLDPIQESELPFDVISEMILTRLPIKSVVRFKSVSKLWYSTLSSPRFAFAHLKLINQSTTQSLLTGYQTKFEILSYEDGDQRNQMDNKYNIDWVNEKVDFDVGKENMDLVGSCNGLVCLGSTSGCLFIIWNPITGEFFKYRDPEISKFASEGLLVTWGFGYVSAVDDYKIVRICRGDNSDFTRVHVYSRRFNKLRRIDDDDDSHNFSGLRKADYLVRHGVLVNETLYWMDHVRRPWRTERLPREVHSCDLATEMFDTSITKGKDAFFNEFLCNVNGCLSKYGRSKETGNGNLTILKRPGEIEQVSFPSFLVGNNGLCDLIGFTGSSKKIFAIYISDQRPRTCLAIIDLTSPPFEHIPLTNLNLIFQTVKYSASLISPDTGEAGTPGNEYLNI